MHPRPKPALRALALAAVTASVIAACGGAAIQTWPTEASATPGAPTTGTACGPAPSPGPLPDWQPPATPPTLVPVIVSSQQTCGVNRFVFSLLSQENRPVAAPDRTAHIAFYNLGRDGATPVAEVDPTFIWGIEGERGVYVASIDFSESGIWGAIITTAAPESPSESIRIAFDVRPEGQALGIGDRAPASKTTTAADVGGDLARLSSDASPEPRFYETSVDAALAAGKPFVLVFATPRFCTSAQCGPTLEIIKAAARSAPGMTFINVEPYELAWKDGILQPVLDTQGQLTPVASVDQWGIVSEPWVFVVDAGGTITASFEGILSAEELAAAIAAVQ